MDNSEIRKEIQEEVRKAEKILVGIGAEWKRGDEDREEQIRRASKALRELLEGKDAFIISTLTLGEPPHPPLPDRSADRPQNPNSSPPALAAAPDRSRRLRRAAARQKHPNPACL